MKKWMILPMVASVAISAAIVGSTDYKVNTNSSNVVWKAYKVTGQHTGNVKVKNGTLTLTDGKLTAGSFEVDMSSITCTDLNGGMAEKLVGHLKSEDFFGVQKYPVAKLVITRAVPVDTKGNYRITGKMSIKETTKDVKFNASVTESNGTVKATGTLVLDRTEYDVRYGSGAFFDNLGDKTIYDEFDLQISIVANK